MGPLSVLRIPTTVGVRTTTRPVRVALTTKLWAQCLTPWTSSSSSQWYPTSLLTIRRAIKTQVSNSGLKASWCLHHYLPRDYTKEGARTTLRVWISTIQVEEEPTFWKKTTSTKSNSRVEEEPYLPCSHTSRGLSKMQNSRLPSQARVVCCWMTHSCIFLRMQSALTEQAFGAAKWRSLRPQWTW